MSDSKTSKGGAHAALIEDQIKWSRGPNDELVFWLNFDQYISQKELIEVLEQHYGKCSDWKIPKYGRD